MPVLVVFEMDKKPTTIKLPEGEFHVGREEGSQLVLIGRGVSRKHAAFTTAPSGARVVRCISETNRLIVDGAVISGDAEVHEGSEILVGADFLLIFSENENTARQYMGKQKFYVRKRCAICGWEGLLSSVRKDPVCPKCANTAFINPADYIGKRKANDESIQSTEHVNHNMLRASMKKLKTAKRSRIERIDGREDPVRELSDGETVHIGGGSGKGFELTGFAIGGGIQIQWSGSAFVAKSDLTFPAMKVNGLKAKSARLKNGDLIEVGKNRFRFVTE